MAAGTSQFAIYYSVSDGKIVRSFKEATASSKSRVNKNGRTVHEELYDYLEGKITAVYSKDKEFNGIKSKVWHVKLEDNDGTYVLEMPYSSGYSSAFLKALPNVNFAEPVRLSPKQTIEGDKKRNTLFINQNGKAVKWFWTKDEPGELPQIVQKKVKGQMVWDDGDQQEFLENYVRTVIAPQLAGLPVTADDGIPEEDF